MIRSALAAIYLLLASKLLLGNFSFDIGPDDETVWYLAGAMPATAIYFLYHLILEPLMAGRTPGKRLAGLRVLTPEGEVPTAGALITRNIFRIVDSMPLFYVVGLLFVFFGRQHLRLGDLAAGTVLVIDRAPFLEKLAPQATEWRSARQRAAALRRRDGTGVDDALAVVDDYRRARAFPRRRATVEGPPTPRNRRSISNPSTPICTTPSIAPRAVRGSCCCR
jgi:uncharacterized RDD family membrane protein YckC